MNTLKGRAVRFRRVRVMVRIHAWITASVLFVYALLGFLWGPSFFVDNLRATWSALADEVTVSATVPAPPVSPVVTAESTCPSGALAVQLEWADDSGATSFDVYRDSSLLVSGIADSAYTDTNVSAGTSYSYVVIASGPMGSGTALSDPVSIVTSSSCLTSLVPTVSIVSVAGTDVSSSSSVSVSSEEPTVTGTSNMPNASVSVSLVGESSVYATLTTNSNGYWEWTPTVALSSGSYTLTVTVTHPLHALQTASDTIELTISSSSGSDGDRGGTKKKKKKPAVMFTPLPTYHVPPSTAVPSFTAPEKLQGTVSGSPVSVSLAVTNPGEWVFQWRTLETVLRINQLDRMFEGNSGEVFYVIRDALGNNVLERSRSVVVRRGGEYREAIDIPREWKSGDYHIVARLHVGSVDVEAEALFRVVELPLFDMGGGILVTWNDAMRFFGWASFGALLWLLMLLLLFVREYWLFLHSSVRVTEETFSRHGFFGSKNRKGVYRS